MEQNIKENIKKVIKKEVILYLIFGIMTTAINIISFYIMANILKWNENVSNVVAIIFSILFAYFTNKDMVFHANAKTVNERIHQFTKFLAGRFFTLVVEVVGGYFLFKLPIPNTISKITLTIIIVIMNFFISKLFAFNNKR